MRLCGCIWTDSSARRLESPSDATPLETVPLSGCNGALMGITSGSFLPVGKAFPTGKKLPDVIPIRAPLQPLNGTVSRGVASEGLSSRRALESVQMQPHSRMVLELRHDILRAIQSTLDQTQTKAVYRLKGIDQPRYP